MSKTDELKISTFNYTNYVRKHKQLVFKIYQEAIKDKLIEETLELSNQILKHDDSKFSDQEFHQYRKNWQPTSFEKTDEDEYEMAKEHHIKNNSHHWEHWVNEDGTVREMDLNSLIELLCDWTTMSIFDGNKIMEFYKQNENEINFHPNTRILFMILAKGFENIGEKFRKEEL